MNEWLPIKANMLPISMKFVKPNDSTTWTDIFNYFCIKYSYFSCASDNFFSEGEICAVEYSDCYCYYCSATILLVGELIC